MTQYTGKLSHDSNTIESVIPSYPVVPNRKQTSPDQPKLFAVFAAFGLEQRSNCQQLHTAHCTKKANSSLWRGMVFMYMNEGEITIKRADSAVFERGVKMKYLCKKQQILGKLDYKTYYLVVKAI
ncbi:uncharacterized protein LOC143207356 [Lasioglossum baleicum]|uniref:uncharacterized protein LOC143207356 n=1 Tax=Lasioglossum baleicum TaxID=434251 RepID=UPI003FCC35A3